MRSQQLLNQELEWIEQIKCDNNSNAFELLFNKYIPMVENFNQRYHIPLYERDDWYQEARIICYQTCLIYDSSHGSKFGSFFKLRLQNHAANLVRHQLAIKRRTNLANVSMDKLLEKDPDLKSILRLDDSFNTELSFLALEYDQFVDNLSSIELRALKLSLEQNCNHNFASLKILRASNRARAKLRLFCRQHNLDI